MSETNPDGGPASPYPIKTNPEPVTVASTVEEFVAAEIVRLDKEVSDAEA